MTTMTISRPTVSSPLADSERTSSSARPTPKRPTPFPSSRPLRPFASISHVFQPPTPSASASKKQPTVKLIEPPQNYKVTFTLNLTQAEFSRQESEADS